ncbi:hypothetical protein ACQ4PT_045755 [Festuca glaucescens]
MDAACESCALWRDHCYWDHRKDEKKPQFSVVAPNDFKNSVHNDNLMSLQHTFSCLSHDVVQLRGRISDTIKLNAPNGITYDIVVSWEMGQAALRSGWDAFVTAHQIEENDTFLFMYLGDSNFEIRIHDSDGCEKTASNFDESETIDLTSYDDDHNLREDARRSPGWQKQVSGCRAKTRKMSSTSSLHTQSGFITHKLNDRASKKFGVGQKAPMSKNLQVMTKCCVGGNLFSLAFCKEYASAYLPSRDQTLTLQLEDKEWDTTLHVRPNSKAIHGGWSDFAIDNDLRLGDICLFAKRGIRSLVMRIHFVRKLGILL